MKKTLLILAAIAITMGLKAQCPLSQAVDFTATDCHGTEVHLFDILDSGQSVLIDFFFTSCGPCQQATPKIVESYSAFGCNMYDVFYMEISDRDSDATCQNWTTNYDVEYPTISGVTGGGTICNTYQIGAFPTVILIKPDHSIVIQDLYPIYTTQTVITALEGQGIQQHDCTPPIPPVGDIIDDFTGTDLNGNEINLYNILDGGQAVLINFFLTNDPYSVNPMPFLTESYTAFGCNEHDVFFMGICANGNDSTCQAWAQTNNVAYPIISREGGGNTIAQGIPVGFYPTVMIIRPDHTVSIRDLYPIASTATIVDALESEGWEQHECSNVNVAETDNATITLYPNPANESTTLKGEHLGTVRIYNALGQKVDEFEADGTELLINTANYSNGFYFLKSNDTTLRLIITH